MGVSIAQTIWKHVFSNRWLLDVTTLLEHPFLRNIVFLLQVLIYVCADGVCADGVCVCVIMVCVCMVCVLLKVRVCVCCLKCVCVCACTWYVYECVSRGVYIVCVVVWSYCFNNSINTVTCQHSSSENIHFQLMISS